MQTEQIVEKLKSEGLKITPQRVSILEAICSLGNHPTAQQIIDKVHKDYPNVGMGTIYNTLDIFIEKGVISKVPTMDDSTRYDWRTDHHHHLYNTNTGEIEDYENRELDRIINDFFKNNSIPSYTIESVKLRIDVKFHK